MNAHPNHKIQRTISHDSSLKPKQHQRQHLSSLTTTTTTNNSHKQEQIRLLAKKLAKKLANSSQSNGELKSSSSSPYYPHHLQLKRRTSVCKNVVFEFEEDQDLANAHRHQQSHAQRPIEDEDDPSDGDDGDDDDETNESREDKENFVLESIGKRISSMAVSIVAKDGRELFGEMPSRKIPMAKILLSSQYQHK